MAHLAQNSSAAVGVRLQTRCSAARAPFSAKSFPYTSLAKMPAPRRAARTGAILSAGRARAAGKGVAGIDGGSPPRACHRAPRDR
eukprot:355531-Chlamydomonas_euryale.AAC.2